MEKYKRPNNKGEQLIIRLVRHLNFPSQLTPVNTEHNGVSHRRVASTYSSEHAMARLPLIDAVRFAESLRKIAQSSYPQKNMDQ